jgi:hypothetical protein
MNPTVPIDVLRKLANLGLALLAANDAVLRQRPNYATPETGAEKTVRTTATKFRAACIAALDLGRVKSREQTLPGMGGGEGGAPS